MLALIGPNWEPSRLTTATDFVRTELMEALRQGKPVIPILIDDTRMPTSNVLPEDLRELAFLNAITVRPDPGCEMTRREWHGRCVPPRRRLQHRTTSAQAREQERDAEAELARAAAATAAAARAAAEAEVARLHAERTAAEQARLSAERK